MAWWKPSGSLSFKVLRDNLFLIDFAYPGDKERILVGRPWVFEGSLFVVEDFDGITPPLQFTFDKATFWVRMTNLFGMYEFGDRKQDRGLCWCGGKCWYRSRSRGMDGGNTFVLRFIWT